MTFSVSYEPVSKYVDKTEIDLSSIDIQTYGYFTNIKTTYDFRMIVDRGVGGGVQPEEYIVEAEFEWVFRDNDWHRLPLVTISEFDGTVSSGKVVLRDGNWDEIDADLEPPLIKLVDATFPFQKDIGARLRAARDNGITTEVNNLRDKADALETQLSGGKPSKKGAKS